MLKKLLCCALLLAPAAPLLAAVPPQEGQKSGATATPLSTASEQDPQGSSGSVNWKVKKTWNIPAGALAFAQTLDEKRVYVLTEDSKVRIFTAEGKELGAVPVAAGVTAIDIAPRGEMLYLLNTRNNRYTAMNISINQTIDVTGAPVRGKLDAPVTIVEFSDFQCPFCIPTAPVVEKVLAAHPDTVRLVFKHFPLTRLHPQAEAAARAAIAAQKQGKFWEMHDALFALGEDGWGADDIIQTTAKKIGLDMRRFTADWNSEETRMALAKDIMDAQNADVNGTPSLFINGTPVSERTPELMNAMIEEALRKAKETASAEQQ